MALDSRKMRFFQGRVWTKAEWDAYQAEQQAKRRPMSKRESQMLLTTIFGLVASASMPPPKPPKLPDRF